MSSGSRVIARYDQLPAHAGSAARVLRLVDDPHAAAPDLARAIAADPFFSARVLRVANSAYYGLSGRVGSLPFAVTVLGFQTVRSLAVVAAAGLDDPNGAPPGFWRAAALCATGCELVAPLVGADPGDAFTVGLLHTLGAALLYQESPPVTLCLPSGPAGVDPADPADPNDLDDVLAQELERHGMSHDVVGARVLAGWHLPSQVCDVIGRHHQPLPAEAAPLDRALRLARALADGVLLGTDTLPDAQRSVTLLTLSQGRLDLPQLPGLMTRLCTGAEGLLAGLDQAR